MRRISDFRIGEVEREIIRSVALGTLVLASFALPGLPMALKPFLKEHGENYLIKTIKKLAKKDVIYLAGNKIYLTKKGKELSRRFYLEDIKIERPSKWDGKWHLVSYDIPDEIKKARDWFRFMLRNLGFIQIQESLWVYPFACKEEIAVIAKHLSINPYIVLMRADYIPDENKTREHFKI